MPDHTAFLASAERRETDVRILEIILHVADGDEVEMERIWHAPNTMELVDILVMLQNRGLDPEQLKWAPMGLLWHRALQEVI